MHTVARLIINNEEAIVRIVSGEKNIVDECAITNRPKGWADQQIREAGWRRHGRWERADGDEVDFVADLT